MMNGFLLYTSTGIRISILIIVLATVVYFFPVRPRFVIPTKLYTSKRIYHTITQCVLCICILLLPLDIQIATKRFIITDKHIPVQILFDVSLSMTADDIKPSRFVVAKQALIGLLHKLEGYNISIIMYSGIPFVYIPFGNNTSAQIAKLETMNLGDFPPTPNFVGTAIGDAILLGIKNLIQHTGTGTTNTGIIILLTDGDSNKGSDPLDIIALAQKGMIPVFVLGVGENNYRIGYDYLNNPVMATINIQLLEDIAKYTNGKFYRILAGQTLEQVFKEIADMITAQEKDSIQYHYTSINMYIVFLIALCLIIRLYMAVSSLKYRGHRKYIEKIRQKK